MSTAARHQVFISHCDKDYAIANAICSRIERHGVRCWIAPRDVAVGEDYSRRLNIAIEASSVFIVVLSRHANHSDFVKAEVECAFTSKVPIFPVRIENVEAEMGLKLFISLRHRIDAYGAGREAALDRFTDAVVRKVLRAPAAIRPDKPGGKAVRFEDFAAHIGTSASYYIRQWQEMDQSGKVLLWNWEAFLGGPFWPFYRGMLGLGLLQCLFLAALTFGGGSVGGNLNSAAAGMLLGWIAISVYNGIAGSASFRNHVIRAARQRRSPKAIAWAGIAAGLGLVVTPFLFSLLPVPKEAVASLHAQREDAQTSGASSGGIASEPARRPAHRDPRQSEQAQQQNFLLGFLYGVALNQRRNADPPQAEAAQEDTTNTTWNETNTM